MASLLAAAIGGWCPLGALAAVALGAIALRRIGRSSGESRGRGLALAGMALATAIVTAEGVWLGALQRRTLEAMDDQAVEVIHAAVTGIHAPRSIAGEVGTIGAVTITRRSVSGLAQPTISVAFNAEGERGTAFGIAEFGTVPGTLPPKLVLRSLTGSVADVAFSIPVPEDPVR